MSWTWGVHPDWEPELQARYSTYGQRFESQFRRWLEKSAKRASRGREGERLSRLDRDLTDILAGRTSGWRHSWRRWCREPWLSRIQAAVSALTSRKPPWELWQAEREFDVANCFNRRIGTAFEVDRRAKRVTFIWFMNLPGPGASDE